MDRDAVRDKVTRAMELGSVPCADEVVRRLEEGLETKPLDEYTDELVTRADGMLKQMLSELVQRDEPRDEPPSTVKTLLDAMYPC